MRNWSSLYSPEKKSIFSLSHQSLPFTCSLYPPPLSFSYFLHCPPPVCFYFSSPPVKWDLKTKLDFFFLDPLLLFSCRFSFHNSILSQHDHHFTSITVFMTRQAFLSISTSTSSATPLEAGSQISTADKDGQFKAKCSNGLSPLIVHPDAYYFTQLCYGGFDTQRL